MVVVLGHDGSLHIHLCDSEEVGPTIYSELQDCYATMWNFLKVNEAIERLASLQVLDDLADV